MKQTPKRVVVIDSVNQEVRETTVTSLKDCQALVGGLIERAMILENGDELYVNEEGLFGDPKHFFWLQEFPHPLAGNAYIIGKVTRGGNNMAARSTTEEIRSRTIFRSKQ